MMLSYEYLNDAVELSNSKIPVLVIENKKIFRQALRSFLDDTIDELFTFSQDFKPFNFNKRGFFISNAIDLDFQNKKLVNKINSLMQKTAVNECSEDLASIQTLLINLFDKLNKIYDFEYDSNFEIDYLSILKLFQFNIDTSSHDLPQLLISYIILLNKYLKFDLFVLHSLYDFFDNNELEGIYETLSLSHINILILSSSKPRHISKFEEIHILDPDLCIIDSDNN